MNEIIKNHPEFPIKENIDYSKIILTEEGEYSYTKRKAGELTINFLKKNINKLEDKIVIDGTANIGSDTILFSLNCKKVYGIEINNENYKALENNIKLYNLDNVELYNKDIEEIMDNNLIEYDILYLDLPWGGPLYYKQNKNEFELKINNFTLKEFIEKINNKNKPKYIIIKTPFNYDLNKLKEFNIITKQIHNYFISILF